MTRHLPLALLLVLLFWTPLPFGSVTPGGVLIAIGLVVALIAALIVTGQDLSGRGASGAWGVVSGLFGLGLLGMLQASPWAGRWLGFLAGGLAAQPPAALGGASQPGLSLAPALSRQAALGWWTLALLFVAAFIVGRRRSAKPWLLGAAVGAAAVQALYGWRQWNVAPYQILGREVAGPARFRGTMVNADHLAVLFEITLAICLAWGWWAWRRSRREPRLAYRLAWLLPPLVCWTGCAAALVGTGSRAALAAVLLGLVWQSALVVGRWGHAGGTGPTGGTGNRTTSRTRSAADASRWLVPVGLLCLTVVGGWFVVSRGPTPELGRQLSRPSYEVLNSSRFAVWAPALSLWRSSPWIGTGLGTFEEGFPRVQPAELRTERWGRAHNDPLELLVTGGLAGAGLLGLALVSLVRRLWQVFRAGARVTARAAALAALAALPVVALHEGVDFGLTVPANAVLLTVLLAVGAAGPTVQEEGAAPLRSP